MTGDLAGRILGFGRAEYLDFGGEASKSFDLRREVEVHGRAIDQGF